MTEMVGRQGPEVSLFALGNTLLRNPWPILRWMVAGGLLAFAAVAKDPTLYEASVTFAPQGNDPARSGLASIAGQLGVSVPVQNQMQSPDFYMRLLESRVVLAPVARDSVIVPELGGRRMTIAEALEIEGGTDARREEAAVKRLAGMVDPSVARTTGLVHVSVRSKSPSVSLAVANSLIDRVNQFNRETRQAQASAERKFIESRLALSRADLRAAEDRLEAFLRTNREVGLAQQFQRDRLQRDVNLQQQVFTSLTQAYEDVRIREVRDVPAIMVIEPPSTSSSPEPSGRARTILLGVIVGGLLRLLLGFAASLIAAQRRAGNPQAEEFMTTLAEIRSRVPGFRRRSPRPAAG